MGYVVPFMNGKGGTGKSVLARAYAVEAARAGASVLIVDLDDVQRTSKHWAEHRKANGLKPEIRVEVATPRLAYDMADRSDVLVIDAPGWADRESLNMARWSTFCVIPSRANRMDDLSETVRLLHALKANGIEDWRFGVALNALRAATATQDDLDARAYLAEVGFKALPGFVRDLKGYEIAIDAYVRLGLLPKAETIGNLQRWDFGQVKAFIKAQNAATLEIHRVHDDEDAYLKGLKGGSAKKGER